MKNIILIMSLIIGLTLAGCASPWSAGCSGDSTGTECHGGTKGKFLSSFFSDTDQQSLDVSKYNFKLVGTHLTENQVELIALDSNNYALGSQYFDVELRNGNYFFSQPDKVKDWSYNFVNLASNIKLKVATAANDQRISGRFILKNHNDEIASTSWTNIPDTGIPTHRK